ncbi:MAG: hypothetical protein LBI42_14260 [Chitinispirillales bacterium]|nr:hypothetical protein [Chitinispirillales bacterium]
MTWSSDHTNLSYSSEMTYWKGLNKAYGYSVRCVKDEGSSSVFVRER